MAEIERRTRVNAGGAVLEEDRKRIKMTVRLRCVYDVHEDEDRTTAYGSRVRRRLEEGRKIVDKEIK